MIGIISDIHGNINALRTVLEYESTIDKWLCLGDIVGYNPDPLACIKKIRRITSDIVAGNHDYGVAGKLDLNWFNDTARQAIEWTASKLVEKELNFLGDLPPRKKIDIADYSIMLAHGSPEPEKNFSYLLHPRDLEKLTSYIRDIDIVFVGHTHVPGFFYCSEDGKWEWQQASNEITINIKENYKYIINVGSVGQPRDGDPRASYALFSPAEPAVKITRIPYDIKAVQQKIYDCGLPAGNALRLQQGR